jgi:predicted acyltransferase (DUF342 family)
MVLRGIGGSVSESRRGPKTVSVSSALSQERWRSSSDAVVGAPPPLLTRVWSRSTSRQGRRSCSASGFRLGSVSMVRRFP